MGNQTVIAPLPGDQVPCRRWPAPYCSVLALLLLSILLGAGGCATYHAPENDSREYLAHAQSDGDEEIRVRTAVLSNDEAFAVLGINLTSRWMQAIWLEVENRSDRPYWLLYSALDPDYFAPNEVAYAYRALRNPSAQKTLESHLHSLRFRSPVMPGTTRSGFVFVTLDQGDKEVDIRLIAHDRLKDFPFFFQVPGLHAKSVFTAEQYYSEADIHEVGEDELRFALHYLPCCTSDKHGKSNGDPLNLIFIGNADDLFPAFVRRGWNQAEDTYWGSFWKTVNSFLFGKRYRYSPISNLYVFNRKQDMALQRVRGAIHQRNHLRLWVTPLRYQGKQIWVGQISRDIGVRFTIHSPTLTTHKIDPDVDEARDNLVEDMLFSGGMERMGFVAGTGLSTEEAPQHNLTGDPYYTDGLRSVMMMDRHSRPMNEVKFFHWDKVMPDMLPKQPHSD